MIAPSGATASTCGCGRSHPAPRGSRGLASSLDVTGPLPSPPRSAAFFDLDKTIIAGSSALAFSRPFRRQGLLTRRAVLRSGYAQMLIMLAGADAATMDALRRRITALCAGWEVAQIRAIVAETLHEIVEPLVYAEATELIAEHKANGDEVVVLSASGLEVVEPIAALVGADRCVATRMADCRAYSDSITDLPLLEAVGHPTAVNPDRALRRIAETRGWPILTFGVPVALRPRIRPSTAAFAGVGLGAALVGAGWYGHLVRRGRRSVTPRS